MLKKFFIFILILMFVFPLCSCIKTQKTEFDGIIRQCQAMNNDDYLLLFHDAEYTDKEKAPIMKDILCIYNTETKNSEIIFSGENLLSSYEDQIIFSDESIIYNNQEFVFMFTKEDGQWQNKKILQGDMALKALSYDGRKYIGRYDEYLAVYNVVDGKCLAQTSDIKNTLQMKWSKDGNFIAMVADSGSAVAVWNWQDGQIMKLRAQEELPPVDNWVDIIGVDITENGRYLLISYLCENDMVIIVWDIEKNEPVDKLRFVDEVTIFDIYGDKILYAVNEGKEKYSLNIYDCASKETLLLEQGGDYYTAGCFANDKKITVNSYNINEEKNTLQQVAY